MKYFSLISFAILIFSCKNENIDQFQLNESEYQKFEINCDRDTILISEGGVKIIVNAKSFDCSENGKINLGYAEILDQSDMIRNKMYTIDDNGNILESGGMFQLKTYSDKREKLKKPIQLEIPTTSSNPKMTVFLPAKNESYFAWTDSNDKVKILNNESISNGDSLYSKNCTSCHSKNMREDITGPALGNIHLYRGIDWLIEFTRNSNKLIASGDSLANCAYMKFGGAVMTSFPNLSDQEIKDIYKYIKNESLLQGLSKDEMSKNFDCDSIMFIDNEGSTSNNGFLIQNLVYESNFNYLLPFGELTWKNVDCFLKSENMTEIESITVSFEKAYDNIEIVLFFANRKIVIPFENKGKNTYELKSAFGKDKILMPIGEEVSILAYKESKEFQYVIESFKIKATNNHFDLKFDQQGKKKFEKKLMDLK